MSEAELHVLRARLPGGILNRARRGELRCPLPVGLIYDAAGRVMLDPDKQVQETVRLLFQTFTRTGSLNATVKYFRRQHLLFPTRVASGAHQGELVWTALSLGRACTALHSPGMQAPMLSVGAAGVNSPMAATATNVCHKSNGAS